MKKPIDEKTPLAAWATLARAEAGMSVEEAVDALAARGHGVKAATIRGIEGGSKGASARLLRFLAAVYGAVPPVQAVVEPAPDLTALVSALSELVGEMREERGQLAAALRGIERALVAVATLREASESGVPTDSPFLEGAQR